MKHVFFTVALMAGLVITTGCVSKEQHQAAQTALTNCEDEKAQLEAKIVGWEQRFDRESTRWEELESSISGSVPKALSEFHDERDRILRLVPEQVEAEVNSYLEDYFATVMQGFQFLKNDNDEIKMQLKATEKALVAVGSDTKSISAAVGQTLSDERALRDAEAAKRQEIAQGLHSLIAEVNDFEQNRINCKNCPDRIKLNRKEREAVLGFHKELVNRLSELQTTTGNIPLSEVSGEASNENLEGSNEDPVSPDGGVGE